MPGHKRTVSAAGTAALASLQMIRRRVHHQSILDVGVGLWRRCLGLLIRHMHTHPDPAAMPAHAIVDVVVGGDHGRKSLAQQEP